MKKQRAKKLIANPKAKATETAPTERKQKLDRIFCSRGILPRHVADILPGPVEIAHLAAMLRPAINPNFGTTAADADREAVDCAVRLIQAAHVRRVEILDLRDRENRPDPTPQPRVPFKKALRQVFPKKRGAQRRKALFQAIEHYLQTMHPLYPDIVRAPSAAAINDLIARHETEGLSPRQIEEYKNWHELASKVRKSVI